MRACDQEIAAILADLALEDDATALEPFAHVEIALVEGGTGATRLGGPALLPRPEAWPVHRWSFSEVEGWPDYAREDLARARARGEVREQGGELLMPLSFLCQVDLAESRAERLPQRGVMLFFASVTTDVANPRFAKRVASAVCVVDPNGCIEVAQPPTPDPFPDGVVALRPERRVYFELPWEELQRVQARLAGPSLARFDAMCVPGDALLPHPPRRPRPARCLRPARWPCCA